MSSIRTFPTTFYTDNNIRYVFLDGNCCQRIADCYSSLQKQLSLPDYFGYNLDALEEVLADPEWITEDKIRIIFLNKTALLKEDPDIKADFLDVFNTSTNEKLEIIYLK